MSIFLSRVGRFSARHRLLVAGIWLALFVALIATYAVGSTRTAPTAASQTSSSTEASETLTLMEKQFPSTSGASTADTLQLVLQAPKGDKVTDPATTSAIADLLASAKNLPGVSSLTDPFAKTAPYVSPDGTVAVSTLTYDHPGNLDQKTKYYDAALAFQEKSHPGIGVNLGGNLLETSAPAAGIGEGLGVVAALLVLVLTFGSLLAAGANLLVAVFGVGLGAIGVVTYGAFFPLGDNAIILAAMLGLAVGIDYSLFILSRFRSELRDGRSVEDAVARSVGTAGTAVVFAGLTVIIALVGLLVVNIRAISEMGIAAAAAVAISVLIALTLLPVLMRTLGRRALPKKYRHLREGAVIAQTPGRRNILAAWGRGVVKRPVLFAIGAIVVLAVVAVPTLSMKTAYNIPGGADPESTERTAYNLVLDKFGGIQSPLLVVAEGTGIASKTSSIESELKGLKGVQQVTPAQINGSGTAALITVIPTSSPISDTTVDLVSAIRSDSTVSGVDLKVTGEAAIYIDEDAQLHQALIKYVIVIAVLSLLLLTVMFRSLLVPLTATFGYLLSLLASFGGSVAVFQWGWLDPIIAAPQGDPMLSLLPILLVGVLFGLAMDYQVFLVSRIQEAHGKGLSPKEAVLTGFTKSAPVLVAAGSIMTVVFAGFASSTMAVAASIAFGLVVGVMADVFLVRLILIPALLTILGESAWWLPKWMDRIIPNIDIEGHALDAHEARSSATPVDRERETVSA
ncbi:MULTISPECIES: MMPL family transporter [unclassified Frondihabitans]|uniref:MMPL family transporter n=1 Tax=unclassified Frondihabitans TaxID=2626248 RepID=UPI000F4EECE9|nr:MULTISPECIES: MMPL family transporter [unclassified Frondihabitans]RPE77814.1 RND superfamily putative drug exporter [Frondihabitans sp. PhB153]RPF08093.1 RND superfamily putative drug exporter [Frondihabitans sp. PhB161]